MTSSPAQFSRMYGFIRARQLDGTFPGDRATGIWPITYNRVRRGWGHVAEADWPYISRDARWPPAEPVGLDAKAKQNRALLYQRITSLDEFKMRL